MSAVELVLLLFAALAAGSINGAVGSGSLVTLPVLLAFGLEPATAVTTNTIAMVTSAFGGVLAYRKELRQDRPYIKSLRYISIGGGIIGSTLLLTTNADALEVIVPILIGFALVLVIIQPQLAARARAREVRRADGTANPFGSRGLRWSIFGSSIYGGYFAAAQGILSIAALGAFSGRSLRKSNGVKNLLTLTVNITAATAFTAAFFLGHADVEWIAVAVMAVGATIGGYTGGRFAKAVPDWVLRSLIIVVAVVSLGRAFLD